MKTWLKRVAIGVPLLVMAWLAISVIRHWDTIQRVFLGGVKVYETVPPQLPATIARPAFLVFSKTNDYRHAEAITAGQRMFTQLAADEGWGIYQTENGAVFSPELLDRFDVVVFSNTTGDVFTPAQRAAFQRFVTNGGGYVGIHGAGDNSHAAWPWYVSNIIGASFTGHPMKPQFQRATIHVEDRTHPATQHLADTWQRTDEWYSFERSPRRPGVHILATLDERSYNPEGMFGSDLRMGSDHPIIWARCAGRGRVLYTALGHTAASYSEPAFRQMITGALNWSMRKAGSGCDPAPSAGAAEARQ